MESANKTDIATAETNCNESSTTSFALTSRILIKAGFARPDSAREAISDICKNCSQISINPQQILDYVGRAEDPDAAVAALRDISQSQPKLFLSLQKNRVILL